MNPDLLSLRDTDITLSFSSREEAEKAYDLLERVIVTPLSEEEFQALCHNANEDDAERFRQGCLEYQCRLFGPKFRPSVVRNEILKEWSVFFKDLPAYAVQCDIRLDLLVSHETGEVVGLDIPDGTLESIRDDLVTKETKETE